MEDKKRLINNRTTQLKTTALHETYMNCYGATFKNITPIITQIKLLRL